MTAPKEPYIRVKNWEQYQHYQTGPHARHPVWVKLYLRIVDNRDFYHLSPADKWLFVGCLILAGRTSNRIPLDLSWISQEVGYFGKMDLKPLIDMEFIEIVGVPRNSRRALDLVYTRSSPMKMKNKRRSYSSNVETVDNSLEPEFAAQVHDLTRRMEVERG